VEPIEEIVTDDPENGRSHRELETEMREAAKKFEFERAASCETRPGHCVRDALAVLHMEHAHGAAEK